MCFVFFGFFFSSPGGHNFRCLSFPGIYICSFTGHSFLPWGSKAALPMAGDALLKCFMSCFSPALLCCEHQLQRDLEEQELPLIVTPLLRWGAHHTSQHVTMKEGQRASSLLGDQNSFSDFLKVTQKQGSLPRSPHGCNSAFTVEWPIRHFKANIS